MNTYCLATQTPRKATERNASTTKRNANATKWNAHVTKWQRNETKENATQAFLECKRNKTEMASNANGTGISLEFH